MEKVKEELASKFSDVADRLKKLAGGVIGYLDKITKDYLSGKYTDEQYRGFWKGMKEKYLSISNELLLEFVERGDEVVENSIRKYHSTQCK